MSKKRDLTQDEMIATANLRRIWDARKRDLKDRGISLTQESAAADLGFVTQSAVSQYLLGSVPLGTDAVLKFARLLAVRPGDIDPRLAGISPVPDRLAGRMNEIMDLLAQPPEVQDQVFQLIRDLKDGLTTQERAVSGLRLASADRPRLSILPE